MSCQKAKQGKMDIPVSFSMEQNVPGNFFLNYLPTYQQGFTPSPEWSSFAFVDGKEKGTFVLTYRILLPEATSHQK